MAENSKGIDPIAKAFVHAISSSKGPQIYELSVKNARAALDNVRAENVETRPADIEVRTLPGGSRGEISIRIIPPNRAKSRLPAVMYFRRGGCSAARALSRQRRRGDSRRGGRRGYLCGALWYKRRSAQSRRSARGRMAFNEAGGDGGDRDIEFGS